MCLYLRYISKVSSPTLHLDLRKITILTKHVSPVEIFPLLSEHGKVEKKKWKGVTSLLFCRELLLDVKVAGALHDAVSRVPGHFVAVTLLRGVQPVSLKT